MPNLIIKDGKVIKILPDTDQVKNCKFDDYENVEELLFVLKWLEEAENKLDDYITNKPWYEKWWNNVRRSDWYHRLWNVFQSSEGTP